MIRKVNPADKMAVSAAMLKNGILHGGLEPDSSYLGEFAIAAVTQDYCCFKHSSRWKYNNRI